MSDSVLLREEREAKKLSLIAARRAQRVAAMHAGNFGKGVDSNFIEKMKADKRAEAEADRAADRRTGEELRRMNRLLTKLEVDEHHRKAAELADVKATWRAQSDRRARREADLDAEAAAQDAVKPEDMGLGAAQAFVGADVDRASRVMLQRRQMARWVAEGQKERADAKAADAERQKQYHDFLMQVTELRGELDAEEAAMRRKQTYDTLSSNGAIAAARKGKADSAALAEAASRKAEVDAMLDDPFLCERPRVGPDGKVSRADFKGLTPEQRRAILDANEAERGHAAREREEERRADKKYVAQARALNKFMARSELEEHHRRRQEMEEHKAVLAAQAEAARAREAKSRADARGEINPGFFARFGTSC